MSGEHGEVKHNKPLCFGLSTSCLHASCLPAYLPAIYIVSPSVCEKCLMYLDPIVSNNDKGVCRTAPATPGLSTLLYLTQGKFTLTTTEGNFWKLYSFKSCLKLVFLLFLNTYIEVHFATKNCLPNHCVQNARHLLTLRNIVTCQTPD